LWFNFAHLFSVSLLPLSTAWMAVSELAPQPVSFYAAVFFLVNATYVLLIRELIDRSPVDDLPAKVRTIMRVRSIATLCLFGVAAVIAPKYPLVGLWICVGCLVVYLKPEAPGAETRISRSPLLSPLPVDDDFAAPPVHVRECERAHFARPKAHSREEQEDCIVGSTERGPSIVTWAIVSGGPYAFSIQRNAELRICFGLLAQPVQSRATSRSVSSGEPILQGCRFSFWLNPARSAW